MTDRAGRWVRVSGDSQSEADQFPDINDYCDSKGYAKGKSYEVHGKSAYKGAQDPYWREVVKDVQDGVIDVVVCWMVDRLDRKNILHAIPMVLAVLDAGGRIEFSEQPECNLDAKSPHIDEQVKAFSDRIHAANQESKIKSKRVLKAHRKRRAAGSAIGRAAWGYRIICSACEEAPARPRCRDHIKLFVPTAEGRRYIPAIYAKAIAGEPPRAIAAWLTAERVPTATGGEVWNEWFLCKLIQNPVYYGVPRNAGQLKTEALVSASAWQQAGAAMKSRARPGRGASKQDKALLAPVCGECYGKPRKGCFSGISPMYRLQGGHGEARQPYYRCTGHGPQRKGCGYMVRVAELDEAVIEAMLGNQLPHFERLFVAGDNGSDEIVKLREQGAELFRKGDYAAAAALAEAAETLESAPRVRPHHRLIVTGQTEGDHFRGLSASQRREYLLSHRIIAGRESVSIVPRDYEEAA